jgi:predicted FMN-binding regulatory protein PaiB
MYVPAHFAANDLDKVAAFVHDVGAADLVTFDGTRLVSTLMPVIWDQDAAGHGRLGRSYGAEQSAVADRCP